MQALVHQRGVSGEFTFSMLPRLHQTLEKARTAGHPYKIVCILGGTNDLSDDDNTPESIFAHLHQMYDLVLSHGALLAAITIPESAFTDAEYVALRTGVNGHIKSFCAKNAATTVCIDLEHHIPYFNADGVKNDELWDDGLHMTPKGYDEFGQFVFNQLETKILELHGIGGIAVEKVVVPDIDGSGCA